MSNEFQSTLSLSLSLMYNISVQSMLHLALNELLIYHYLWMSSVNVFEELLLFISSTVRSLFTQKVPLVKSSCSSHCLYRIVELEMSRKFATTCKCNQ